MQTADQVPQPPQAPIYPQYVPAPSIPSIAKRSSGLIKTSFAIGLILLVLGLIQSLLINFLPNYLINRMGWKASTYGLFNAGTNLVVFVIPGIIGLIFGIVGFGRLAKEPQPHKYFMSVTGIALCFSPAIGLIHMILNMLSGLLMR